MEDPEQMGYIHLDRFLPVMSRWEISCFIFLFFCIQSHLRASNIWVGCGSDENFRPILIPWTTTRIILQEKFLPAAHEDLLAAFQVREHACMCWCVCMCALIKSSPVQLFMSLMATSGPRCWQHWPHRQGVPHPDLHWGRRSILGGRASSLFFFEKINECFKTCFL